MEKKFSLLAHSLLNFNHVPMSHWFDSEQPVWFMLKTMNKRLQNQISPSILSPIPEGVVLVNKESIHIEEGCTLEPGSWIQGPCYLGAGTQVRQGAYLRGFVLTGKNCVLGHATEAKNAIFCDEAKAGHFAYVGDSILGHGVNLGAGVKCANLRFDHKPLCLHWEDTIYETSMKKFGAMIGDGCELGCNSVTSPGTLLGPLSWVWPLTLVKGVHPPQSKIQTTQ